MPSTSTINIGGDQAENEQQHHIDQLKWLTDHISSLYRKEKKYSQEIENDYQYIIGRKHKNVFGKSFSNSKSSISFNNSEQKPSSFSNKPVIDAKINQKTSKLFLDSGSEINICDENYLSLIHI